MTKPIVCYWCGKEIAEEDMDKDGCGLPIHHDCKLEEQSGWESSCPPVDL